MLNIVKNIKDYQKDEFFIKHFTTTIKVILEEKEYILKYRIPNILLYELDKSYYQSMMKIKGNDDFIAYAIFGKYESFEGFEKFIMDFLENKCELNINNMTDIHALQTSFKFIKSFYAV